MMDKKVTKNLFLLLSGAISDVAAMMKKDKMTLKWGICFVIFLSSCAAPQTYEREEKRPVWPQPPMEAKIEWVREYQVLSGMGKGSSFWGSVKDFFLGPEETRMIRPYGVCTDNDENLFVADAGGARIHIFNMRDEKYSVVESNEQVAMVSPIGLTVVDASLYVTDSYQGRIYAYDVKQGKLKQWSPFKFHRPTGIAYYPEAHLFYVSDTAAHEIIVLNSSGVEKFRFGRRGKGAGEFNFPTDLWIDKDSGKLYVTDSLNARIQIFSTNGEFQGQFGRHGDTPGSFSKPKGVAVDQHGHIFVSDALFDAVQVFDQRGQVLLSVGDNGSRPGQFSMPSGLFIDRRGYIYVSDTYNRRIQVFKELMESP